MKTSWVPFVVTAVVIGVWCLWGDEGRSGRNTHQDALSRDALINLASIAYNEGKLAEAQSHLEAARIYDPYSLDIKTGLATVMMAQAAQEEDPAVRKGMMRQVIMDYLDVAEARSAPEDWTRLAAALSNAGFKEEAAMALEEAKKAAGT
jgi:tetratricopeptide (TPR) repeat protein